jgi:fumarylpyruvate hydrolase
MRYVFPPPDSVSLPVMGGGRFPVRRIFCIGRNYADHVREMGGDPKSDPPVFFTKPADAAVESGAVIPYPPSTDNLHYEAEMVIALKGVGANLSTRHEAGALIYGSAVGCDLTRRDLQAAAKKAGGPWDAAKAFDNSAPVGLIAPIEKLGPDLFDDARIKLFVNESEKQSASLRSMIFTVPEILIALSRLFELRPGDLVFTGTPEGVGPLVRGDRVRVELDPLPPLEFSIAEGG